MEFTLLGATLIAVGGLWLTLRLTTGGGARQADSPFDTALAAIGIGILAGRLAAMISTGTNPLTHIGDVLIIRGGVSTGVASLAAVGTWAWMSRGDLPARSDAMAGAALVGLAGWHAGCLVRDACAGTATSLPWAVTLPGSTVGRHPVELYVAIGLVAGALVLPRLPLAVGGTAGGALGLAAAMRLVTEPMRASLGGGPVVWYWSGVVAGLAVILISQRAGQDSGLHSPM